MSKKARNIAIVLAYVAPIIVVRLSDFIWDAGSMYGLIVVPYIFIGVPFITVIGAVVTRLTGASMKASQSSALGFMIPSALCSAFAVLSAIFPDGLV